MTKQKRWLLLAILAVLVLSACAAGENPAVDVPNTEGDLAGFWIGLWQGLIVPVTFIISLFTESVSIYEVHNTGGWYDFGFLIGTASVLGSGGAGARGATK